MKTGMNATLAATEAAIPDPAWVQALGWLQQADGLIVAAGAGMGVDSGLPDFRGSEGLWRAYPALRHAGLEFTRIASPGSFLEQPTLAWGFYGHRLAKYRETVPHEGFSVLLRWARRMKNGSFVFTSNVDGQFQQAGFTADAIMECHGSLHWLQCMHACSTHLWAADDWFPDVDEVNCRLVSPLPECPECGALARPNVLMFDDHDWVPDRTYHQQQRLEAWLGKVSRPVVVELGAGTAVPTVRWFASRLNAPVIRINLRESAIDSNKGIGLAGRASDILSELDRRWQI
ncbi:MAG: Sir2 family NAD-dependent protein deacetylase [Burkholderiaceae bacterium]